MKKLYILILLSVVCVPVMGQVQNLRQLLDTAYTVYNSRNVYFAKKFSLYNPDQYSIERIKEVKDLVLGRRDLILTDSGKHFKIKIHKKLDFDLNRSVLDFPSFFLYGDTILIYTTLLSPQKKGFSYGTGECSLFVYNKATNRWQYDKSWRPELNFRSKCSFTDFTEICFRKAIEQIKNKGNKNPKIFRIEEYWPGAYYNREHLTIPSGAKSSWFKKKADYFVGYPEATLDGNTITISLRIIESKDITDIENLKNYETVSITYDFSHSYFYQQVE